jgi:putative transposase
MARQRRFILPGQPLHVIQRGNNRDILFAANQDYRFYLEKLAEACKRFSCEVHAYVLMTNHVHLLMTPREAEGIGQVMQSLGRCYVQYFNYSYRRTGTLWEGRYRATLIDAETYLLTCYRYIELNPVRAGMVEQPADYPWSSYGYNALGKANQLISPHALYRELGRSEDDRRKSYRSLFKDKLGDDVVSNIRESTNKAWVLGNDRFKEQIEKLIDRQAAPKLRGGDRKSKKFQERKQINRV